MILLAPDNNPVWEAKGGIIIFIYFSVEEMTTHSSILAWRICMDRGAWRATVHEVAGLDMTEWLTYTQ